MKRDRNNRPNAVRDTQGRFAPGNPGRPRGARHRATLAAEALLDGEAEVLTRKAIDLALSGDTTALRLCLERLLPPVKARPVAFDLAAGTDAAALRDAAMGLLRAVADGAPSADEAATVVPVLDGARRAARSARPRPLVADVLRISRAMQATRWRAAGPSPRNLKKRAAQRPPSAFYLLDQA